MACIHYLATPWVVLISSNSMELEIVDPGKSGCRWYCWLIQMSLRIHLIWLCMCDSCCLYTDCFISVSYRSISDLEEQENSLHPAVLSGDLGLVVELKKEWPLTKHEQYHVLTNHCLLSFSICSVWKTEASSTPLQWLGVLGEREWRIL